MTIDPHSLAFDRIVASHPWLVGVRPARDVVPGLRSDLILHAGPPTGWAGMSDLMRGGMVGAALFEGLAATPEEAVAKAASGEIAFAAAQDHGAMAGGVGSITSSMPVMVVEDRSNGNVSAHFLMEGLGRTLVSGTYDDVVAARLRWLRDSCGPILDRAIAALGGIDLRDIIAEALRRGDELHNRNAAATAMLMNRIALGLLDLEPAPAEHRRILAFMAGNPQFFVGVSLPAAQLMLRGAAGLPGCGLVTAIAANGRDCGIQVSGLPGRWFTAPVDRPTGVLMAGASPKDIAPACGDSFLGECAGFGASILPAAPALWPVIGASAAEASAYAEAAYANAFGEHPAYLVPALGFRGIPVGVDARKVVASGAVPVIDIAMSHRTPGLGLVGMGIVRPPLACFVAAVAALDEAGAA